MEVFSLRSRWHSMAYLGVTDGLHLQKHFWNRVYALFLFVWEIPRSLFDYVNYRQLSDSKLKYLIESPRIAISLV